MPPKAKHLAQARHNEDLAKYLDGSPYTDWIAVTVFYAALHYIEAYLDTLKPPVHCRIHQFRDRVLADLPATNGAVYKAYRHLKDVSEEARYQGIKVLPQELQDEVYRHLDTIRRSLKSYLAA